MCRGLKPSENVKVNCYFVQGNTTGHYNNSNNKCTEPQRPGTIAKYRCEDYFIPYDYRQGQELEHRLKCHANGEWKPISRFNSFLCIQDCGRRGISPNPLIINGLTTNSTYFPWHVNLYTNRNLKRGSATSPSNAQSKETGRFVFICGGSIVRNSIVLTAAHCVTNAYGDTIDPSALKVIVGAQTHDYVRNTQDRMTQVLSVKRIYLNEAYDRANLQADIAIIHLEGQMTFNDMVSSVCLPTETSLEVEVVKPGRFGEVAGFGIDENGSPSNNMKYGSLQVKSRSECFSSLHVRLSESQLCAGAFQAGTDNPISVCNGDSGGGLVFPSPLLEKHFVYGITSFTNSQLKRGKKCQDNAVFTRVLPFMSWIRTIIEEIHGSILSELTANSMVPYIQHGREEGGSHRERFGAIPTGVGNKITSIELTNLLIDPDELLKSLENTPFIKSLNLTNVKLTSRFDSKVRLPYLSTFILDIASITYPSRDDLLVLYGEDEELVEFIQTCLFFQKEYEHELELEQILGLGMNIQLTFQQHKLINIDYTNGRIILNRIPTTTEILKQIPSEQQNFHLEELALNECQLNLTDLILRMGNQISRLTSLKLHSVQFVGNDELSALLQYTPRLEVLIIDIRVEFNKEEILKNIGKKIKSRVYETTFYLSQLPYTLKFLSFNNVNLNYKWDYRVVSTTTYSESQLHFQTNGTRNENPIPTFPNLYSFYCDSCQIDNTTKQSFHTTFPNLKHFGTETHIADLRQLVTGLNSLESIYALKVSYEAFLSSFFEGDKFHIVETGQFEGFKPFVANQLLTGWKKSDRKVRRILVQKSFINGSWSWSYRFPEEDEMDYEFKILNDFYTSFEEQFEEERLQIHERFAVKTSNYTFKGEISANDKYRHGEVWPVDFNLFDSKISSISVSQVQLSSNILQIILERSNKLQSINFRNIYLYGSFKRQIHANPNLHDIYIGIRDTDELDYSVNRVVLGNLNKTTLNSLIPFTTSRSLLLLKEDESQVDSFTWGYSYLIHFAYSIHERKVYLAHVNFATEYLELNWDSSINFVIRELTISECGINFNVLPATVEFLTLSKVMFEVNSDNITNESSDFEWSRFKSLTHLILMDPKLSMDEWILDADYFYEIDLLKIATIESLEHLTMGAVQLSLNTQIPATPFKSITTLCLDTCTFDKSLLGNNTIWKLFPVSQVAILMREIRIPKNPSYVQSQLDYEVLFLSALKNEKLELIICAIHLDWINNSEGNTSETVDEIKNILSVDGTFNRLVQGYIEDPIPTYSKQYFEHVIKRRKSDGAWIYAGNKLNDVTWWTKHSYFEPLKHDLNLELS